MKIKVYYCVIDCGDGSYYPAFYATREEAEAREQEELEEVGHVPCEAVGWDMIDVEDYEEVVVPK